MNRKHLLSIFLLFCLMIFILGFANGQDLSYQGQLDTVLILGKIDKKPVIDSISELQGQLDWGTMDYQFYLDASVFMGTSNLNPLLGNFSGLGVQLNKLYFQSWLEKGELKVGKQRIAWGSGYFYNPTDLINPFDLYSSELKRRNTACLY